MSEEGKGTMQLKEFKHTTPPPVRVPESRLVIWARTAVVIALIGGLYGVIIHHDARVRAAIDAMDNDMLLAPCERFGSYSADKLPARCLSYYTGRTDAGPQ